MINCAVVLAAGKSTRIAPVNQSLPKPLIPLRGTPILVRNIRWLFSQGVKDIWVNLHHRPDQIRAALGDGSEFGVHIRYSFEPEILGTAGAIRKLRQHFKVPFWVIYGDSLVNFSLSPLEQMHYCHSFALSLAIFRTDQHPHTGVAGGRVVVSPDGYVLEFSEGGQQFTPYVNAGVYLVNPEVVNLIPTGRFFDFGYDLLPLLLKRGTPVGGHLIDGYCLGIDTPEAFDKANELINSGKVVLT